MLELVIDNFAGGGGASHGIEKAIGRSCDYAINHNREALAMHKANHPNTTHLPENVWNINPLTLLAGRSVSDAWFSPDCTFFSKARGGKPYRDPDAARRVRGLASVITKKWARLPKHQRPKRIYLENVEEFQDWGPLLKDGQPCPLRRGFNFQRWWRELENLGYEIQMRELRACDYGAPTSRKRLFIIARCDGLPIRWPERMFGPLLTPFRTAADCVDWFIPVPSIFLTKEEAIAWGKFYGCRPPKRPLAEATLRRIARGVFRYVLDNPRPFIVSVAHGYSGGRREYPLDEPLGTVSAGGIQHAIVLPSLVQIGWGERDGQAPRCLDINKPLGTIVADGNKHALVPAFLARHYGGHENDGQPPTLPFHTITTQDHHALITAHIQRDFGQSVGHAADVPLGSITSSGGGKAALVSSHIVKLKGTCKDGQQMDHPLHTVQASGLHYGLVRSFLIKYYGADEKAHGLQQPLATITTKDRFGLVTVEGEDYALADIGMRMFTPRELFTAQGFPADYIIDPLVEYETENGIIVKRLTSTGQIRMCGNSVPPPVAEAIVRANYEESRAERVA